MKVLSLVTTVLLSSVTAHALPLLSESASLNTGSALTLYPDHLDPSKFYFMPNSSMIGRDSSGTPTFSLTYYGLSDPNATDAGALMVYVGRLTSDPAQAAALTGFLQSHPGAGIAVLPIKESTIMLKTADGKPALQQLFTEFDFSEKGGRAEDEFGVNAMLTKTGARVFKASILGEAGASMNFFECYKVQGLGPSMDATIHVAMDRVYDYFAASASAGGWWWRASIKTEIENLHEAKVITWTINGGDAKDEDYVIESTRIIMEQMFKPELSMSPSSGSSIWDQATPFSFGASYTSKHESKVTDFTITRRDLIEREYCLPLTIKDLQPYKNKCVINADAN